MRKYIIKLLAGNLIGRVTAMVFAIWQVRFMSTVLDAELFGVWALTAGLFAFSNYLDFGLSLGMQNRLAEPSHKGDLQAISQIVSNGMIMLAVSAAFAATAGIYLSATSSWQLVFGKTGSVSGHELNVCGGMATLVVVINLLAGPALRLAAAGPKNWIQPWLQILMQLISALATVLLHKNGSRVELILIASQVHFIVLPLLNVFIFARGINISTKLVNGKLMSLLIRDGVMLAIPQFCYSFFLQFPQLYVSHSMSIESTGKLAFYLRYCTSANALLWTVFSSFWPSYAKAAAEKDYKWIRSVFLRNLGLASVLALAASVFTFLWGNRLLETVFTKAVFEADRLAMIGSVFWIGSYAFVGALAAYYNGCSKYLQSTLMSVLGLVAVVPMTLGLVSAYGYSGAVLACGLGTLLMAVAFGLIELRALTKK